MSGSKKRISVFRGVLCQVVSLLEKFGDNYTAMAKEVGSSSEEIKDVMVRLFESLQKALNHIVSPTLPQMNLAENLSDPSLNRCLPN